MLVGGIGTSWQFGVSAGALAAANVAVAVALHRGAAYLLCRLARLVAENRPQSRFDGEAAEKR